MRMIGESEAHRAFAKYMVNIVKEPKTVSNAENASFQAFIKKKGEIAKDKIEAMEQPLNEKWYEDHPKTRGLK